MLDLIRFELKKMLSRRVAQVACGGILVLLCGIMALNVMQTKTEGASGEVLSGLEAIAHNRESAQAHAGVLTPERVQADLDAYCAFVLSKVGGEDIADLSDAAAYDLVARTCSPEERVALYDPYLVYLLSPWKMSSVEPFQKAVLIDESEFARFYPAVADRLQAPLDDGMRGTWTYSPAERDFWTQKQEQVSEPFTYGYVGGWEDMLACLGFLALAMVAVCVALTPVFAGEYQDKTDAVLLSARYGRSKLVAAKIVASFLFATAYFALCALVVVGVPLVFFGAEGGGLPLQNLAVTIPYNLTMAQAALIGIGLAYLITLALAALTLALSSRLRSVLAIFAIDVAIIFLSGIVGAGGNGILQHILYLFPLNALVDQPLFAACVSYPFGPVVLDLQAMLVAVQLVVLLVCLPVAVVSFRRHQVA